jgi:hypothetical protein
LLHARRQVRGLADGRIVHVQVVADRAHHHLPGVETHPDLHLDSMGAAHLRTIAVDGLLHGQGRITGPHGMVLMGDGGPKQCHNAIAQHLVDGPLEAMHGVHQAFEDRVEELPCFLRVALGEQLHGALQVGKEDGDLLALPLEGVPGSEDFFGQMVRGIGERRLGLRCKRGGDGNWRLSGERGPTFAAKRKPRGILKATVRAALAQGGAAVATKIHTLWVCKATARAVHRHPPHGLRSELPAQARWQSHPASP